MRFLSTVIGVVAVATAMAVPGCSAAPKSICGCLVVWYNAENGKAPDPLSTGWDDFYFPPGIGVEAAGVIVECPNSGNCKTDAGSSGSAASSEMEARARAFITKHEGFKTDASGKMVPVYNPTTLMGSFIKVVSCKEYALADFPDAGPKPGKTWIRYHSKQRPGMYPKSNPSDAGAPGIEEWNWDGCLEFEVKEDEATGALDVYVWNDCPFAPKDAVDSGPAICEAPACEDHSGVNPCVDCMQEACCSVLDACFEDLNNADMYANNCICRLMCHGADGTVQPGCEATCSGSASPTAKVASGCAELHCASACSALVDL